MQEAPTVHTGSQDDEQPAGSTLPRTAAETSAENPWPLRLLSAKLKTYIERSPETWIEGQLIENNIRNGNAYLTMRDVDEDASLPLVAWSNVMNRLDAPLEPGARVVALVKPSFWIKGGRLSMQTREIRPVGLGDLLARIERLRRALAAEGLFDAGRKRRLPVLPHRIGLITGRDSDAEKDVVRNTTLRWPAVEFEIRQVAVQGARAVAEVTAALRELDAAPGVDLIVIARGGGSLEDLLAFSSEELVRAVAAATTPVVSAIGHEADRPLLDEVADLRASTPTDAAKRIVPDVAEELQRIHTARERLDRAITMLIHRESERLSALRSRPVMAFPAGMIDARAEDLERLRGRVLAAARTRVARELDAVRHLRAQIRALSPQHTLDRGYAVVQLPDGAVLRDAAQADIGTGLRIRVAVGEVRAETTAVLPGQAPELIGAPTAPDDTGTEQNRTPNITGTPNTGANNE